MAKLLESRSIDYVPLAERHGKVWHLWPVWFAGDAHLATVAVGVLGIAVGGNLLWTSIAVILGCLLGTFFMAFHSTQGPQLGLPQMIQSRPQFGYTGALLVWGVAMVSYIGYNAFNQVLAGQAVHQLYPAIAATSPVAITVFALFALALAAVGYDKIHLAQRGFAYLMILILTVFTVWAAFGLKFPAGEWDTRGFRGVPFLAQLFGAASYQLSWSIWWTYLGAFIGGAWMMLIGTVAAALAPKLDVCAAIEFAADQLYPGFGKVLLIGALLGLVAVSTLNFYGASLTLLSMADTVRPLKSSAGKRLVSLAVAFIASTAIALASSGSFGARFNDLLSVLLYLFTPWTAINLIDFYVVRKGHYSIREIFNPDGMYGRWNWRGLTAYVAGFVAMIPFFVTDEWKGPIARALGGADIAMLIGLPVAAGVYLWAYRAFDLPAEERRAAVADAGLDSGAPATARGG
jgi:NCS1 family nucleobase:cation symporter-1